ncbi:MAG: FAD/NAD(P)-binding oxidoreductase [Betaproteobacteria bacterium]|nr:MAG: FAD/NAD(P)-binding oxidoreductase [Betaproteobacteria bacterium]
MADPAIAIVGAGPAGIRAAEALSRHGLSAILVDEAPKGGGQIYRQPPDSFQGPASSRYGFEARKASALHLTIKRLATAIDYRPSTLAWNVCNGRLDTLCAGRGESVVFDILVIATGAMDRMLPLPGWTLPGVYALGGAQIALKYQGCAIGQNTVFLGTGPLLYLVAYQYAKAGAKIEAVLDVNPAHAKRRALFALASSPRTLAKGIYYRASLGTHGIAVEEGVTPMGIAGTDEVRDVHYRRGSVDKSVRCDAVGLGFGLKSETQDGESTVSGVYLAGDGAGIGGADAAELWGERVGLSIAARCGRRHDASRIAKIDRRLARLARFRAGLERAFPLPLLGSTLPDDTILCRCESIRVGQVKDAIRAFDVVEMNRMKAISRVGMGRCQGRMCGHAAAELLAAETRQDLAAVGRLRGQPPIKPLPMPWPGTP